MTGDNPIGKAEISLHQPCLILAVIDHDEPAVADVPGYYCYYCFALADLVSVGFALADFVVEHCFSYHT